MLAEIFMLRLEATARVAAQEAPKYSLGTRAERKTSGALLNIRLAAIWKAWLDHGRVTRGLRLSQTTRAP
jgi:hypothetical protein